MAEQKEKPLVWKIIDTINDKTPQISMEDITEQEYSKLRYTIDRAFSQYPDTIFLINELNKLGRNISNKEHYDFLYYSVPKKKRFSKWIRKEAKPELVSILREINISEHRVKEIMDVLTEEQLDHLIKRIEKGGKK